MADAQVLALVQQHNKPFNAGAPGCHATKRLHSKPACAIDATLCTLRMFCPAPCAVGIGDYLATKGIKKAAVQRALDNLAAAGKLTAKVHTAEGRTFHQQLFMQASMHFRVHAETHSLATAELRQ